MSKKILLVDDDARFQATVTPVLKSRGYTVITATNAREAGVESKSADHDLLIVDGQLPDGDGISLIEEFRKRDQKTPIIFVSATWRDTESYHKLTKQLSCRSILHKPILPAVLAQEVDKILDYSAPLPVPRPAAGVALQEKLAGLSLVFGKQLPGEIGEIESLIAKAKNETKLSYAGEASRKAHKLHGTAASYGFPRVSALMGKIEEALTGLCMGANTRSLEAIWKEVNEEIKECKLEAAKAPTTFATFQPADETAIFTALIISNDDAVDGMLSQYAAEQKVELNRCALDSAENHLRGKRFDLVIIDPAAEEEKIWQIISRFRNDAMNQAVPIALIKADSKNTCAEEIHHGIDITLSRPLSVQALYSAFQHLLDLRNDAVSRVMVIDDDKTFIRRAESLLSSEGIKVTSFQDSNRLLDILPDIKPNLLLLDIDMPGISGFDVCRKIRDTEQWHSLPTIFVSAMTNWETRVAAYECGGDDYLSKPVVNAELLQKTLLWLERSKQLSRIHEIDALTGLYNHSAFSKNAKHLLEKTAGVGKEFSLIFFKLKNIHWVNEKFDAGAGDQLLRSTANMLKRSFPLQSIRGRWSGTVLAVALNAHASFAEQAAKSCQSVLNSEHDNARTRPDLEIKVFSTREPKNSIYRMVK